MIKELNEIPREKSAAEGSARSRIQADIEEAIGKGFHVFEFEDTYCIKGFTTAARTAADDILEGETGKAIRRLKEEGKIPEGFQDGIYDWTAWAKRHQWKLGSKPYIHIAERKMDGVKHYYGRIEPKELEAAILEEVEEWEKKGGK